MNTNQVSDEQKLEMARRAEDEWYRRDKGPYIPGADSAFIEGFLAALAISPPVEGWISVEDRLPDDDCSVLVADWVRRDGQQHIDIAHFRRGTGSFHNDSVTHWMPLPPSPNNQEVKPKSDTGNLAVQLGEVSPDRSA